MSEAELIPAEVFHPAQYVADAAIERGWTIWDFVERIGTLDAPLDVLAWQLYAASAGFDDIELRRCLMGETWAMDLERVFGASALFWQRMHDRCQAHLDRIAPLEDAAIAWYGLDEQAARSRQGEAR